MTESPGGIIKIGSNLLVRLDGDLDDEMVNRLESKIVSEVEKTHAQGMLIDVSGLTLVDSFVARIIARIVSLVRLLGAETVVVGIQPAVAITLVELGVRFHNITTALNAEQGMELLEGLKSQ